MEWVEPSGAAPPSELVREIAVSPPVARVLYARGCRDAEAMRQFLDPPQAGEWDSSGINGIAEARTRLEGAVKNQDPICVCGGRDSGDLVAVALGVVAMRQLGANVRYEVGGERAGRVGAALVVNLEKAGARAGALSLGGDGAIRVEAAVADAAEPVGRAGVLWLVMQGIGGPAPAGRDWSDLVALSTLIDAVPLTGLNRSLARAGLVRLCHRPRPGLQALLRQAKLYMPSTPQADFVDYALEPRFAAAAQKGAGDRVVALLLSEDQDGAAAAAADLEAHYTQVREERGDEAQGVETGAVAVDAYVELSELQPALSDELSRLGPFGRGNPKPVFATRRARLVNPTGTGLSRRHARLVVEDEAGQRQPGVWWRKSPAAIPREWGDVAYSLRVDAYRASERLQLEIIDFRPQEADPALLDLAPLSFAVVDRRGVADRGAVLAQVVDEGESVQVWAEGAEAVAGAQHRRSLQPGAVLVIWSAPPGPAVVRSVLQRVRPRKVVLLTGAVEPVAPGPFLRQLGGLAKGVLSQRDGAVRVDELAGRLGGTEAAVLAGLELLAARGLVGFREDAGRLQLSNEAEPGPQDRQQLATLLAEVDAYRRYFSQAPADEVLRVDID